MVAKISLKIGERLFIALIDSLCHIEWLVDELNDNQTELSYSGSCSSQCMEPTWIV